MESQKTNFYAAEEYLLYQKTLLKRELKAVIKKNVMSTVDLFRSSTESQYQLYFRQRVKKFFALSFRQIAPVA